MQRSTVIGRFDCGDEGGVSTSATSRSFTGALAAQISLVDLDAQAGGAKLVTAVSFKH